MKKTIISLLLLQFISINMFCSTHQSNSKKHVSRKKNRSNKTINTKHAKKERKKRTMHKINDIYKLAEKVSQQKIKKRDRVKLGNNALVEYTIARRLHTKSNESPATKKSSKVIKDHITKLNSKNRKVLEQEALAWVHKKKGDIDPHSIVGAKALSKNIVTAALSEQHQEIATLQTKVKKTKRRLKNTRIAAFFSFIGLLAEVIGNAIKNDCCPKNKNCCAK